MNLSGAVEVAYRGTTIVGFCEWGVIALFEKLNCNYFGIREACSFNELFVIPINMVTLD